MNIPIIIVALVALSIGIVSNQMTAHEEVAETLEDVLSEVTEETPTPDLTASSSASPEPTEAPTSTPTSSPNSTPAQTGNFIYPGATVISTGATIELSSSDNAQAITDWYKEKIRNMGMNVKSFVQTSSNNNIKNKLAGADGNREVEIEITKSSDSSTVHISVKE